MNNRNDINVFDQYAQGVLNEVERKDFENQLKTDFREFQETIHVVQQFERVRLKEMLLQSEPPQRAIVRSMNRGIFRMGIAASIALLIGWMGFHYSQSDERLYQAYKLDDSQIVVMSGEKSETINARAAYENGLKLRDEGDFEAAIANFSKVGTQRTNLYFISQYNIAMLQFKTGNKEKAKIILTQLTERSETHFIKNKAQKALEAMEKNWFF